MQGGNWQCTAARMHDDVHFEFVAQGTKTSHMCNDNTLSNDMWHSMKIELVQNDLTRK